MHLAITTTLCHKPAKSQNDAESTHAPVGPCAQHPPRALRHGQPSPHPLRLVAGPPLQPAQKLNKTAGRDRSTSSVQHGINKSHRMLVPVLQMLDHLYGHPASSNSLLLHTTFEVLQFITTPFHVDLPTKRSVFVHQTDMLNLHGPWMLPTVSPTVRSVTVIVSTLSQQVCEGFNITGRLRLRVGLPLVCGLTGSLCGCQVGPLQDSMNAISDLDLYQRLPAAKHGVGSDSTDFRTALHRTPGPQLPCAALAAQLGFFCLRLLLPWAGRYPYEYTLSFIRCIWCVSVCASLTQSVWVRVWVLVRAWGREHECVYVCALGVCV